MIYIVNVSGGLTSFEALRRTIEKHGKDNTHAIFADTLIEDEDLYRFLDDQERYFGIEIERVKDGRTPWQVMKDKRCIKIPRFDMAPCSKALKREAIDRVITARYAPGEYTRVFGMDWTEMHRIDRLQAALAPLPVWFPLIEKPFTDKCQIAAFLERIGIAVPRLYAMGFAHNNCGGGCVKAGQAHWAHLWRTMPDRYSLWEAKEQEIREHLGKDVTILRRQQHKQFQTMTLKVFRERIESGDYDKDDWGGCGCFVSAIA